MELINRIHPSIAWTSQPKSRQSAYVRISGKEVYFSTLAVKQLKLKSGDMVEFIEMDGQWFLIVTGGNAGFPVNRKNKTSMRITSRALVNLMKKTKETERYRLEKTSEEYAGHQMVKFIKI